MEEVGGRRQRLDQLSLKGRRRCAMGAVVANIFVTAHRTTASRFYNLPYILVRLDYEPLA